MKFKPGQKVRVKEEFWKNNESDRYISGEMQEFSGKEIIISEIDNSNKVCSKSNFGYDHCWESEWLEPIEESCNCKEMSCLPGCAKKHTCKTFWCEICKPKERTLDDVQQGDVITNGHEFIKVFEVYGNISFTGGSYSEYSHAEHGPLDEVYMRHIHDLRICDFRIYQPESSPEPEVLEVSLQEVADKFNVDVKSIRVKE